MKSEQGNMTLRALTAEEPIDAASECAAERPCGMTPDCAAEQVDPADGDGRDLCREIAAALEASGQPATADWDGRDLCREIAEALEAAGVRVSIEDAREFAVIRAGEDAAFIVLGRFAGNPDAARAVSEKVASRLEAMRGRGKAMFIAPDLWARRPEMMLRRMLAHCGIFSRVFARNCEVRRIHRPEADTFMNAWHSYGTAVSRYYYGLFTLRETRSQPRGILLDNSDVPASQSAENQTTATAKASECGTQGRIIPAGTMVGAAEFSNARRWTEDGRRISSYEWVRYASLPDVRVDGGMGKILKKFIAEVHPDRIMTYADLEWSDGGVYRRLGFSPVDAKGPMLFRIDPATMRRIPLSGSRKAIPGNNADTRDALPEADARIPDSPLTENNADTTNSLPGNNADTREASPKTDFLEDTKKPETIDRSPEKSLPQEQAMYYQNFGSARYRLSLTD